MAEVGLLSDGWKDSRALLCPDGRVGPARVRKFEGAVRLAGLGSLASLFAMLMWIVSRVARLRMMDVRK